MRNHKPSPQFKENCRQGPPASKELNSEKTNRDITTKRKQDSLFVRFWQRRKLLSPYVDENINLNQYLPPLINLIGIRIVFRLQLKNRVFVIQYILNIFIHQLMQPEKTEANPVPATETQEVPQQEPPKQEKTETKPEETKNDSKQTQNKEKPVQNVEKVQKKEQKKQDKKEQKKEQKKEETKVQKKETKTEEKKQAKVEEKPKTMKCFMLTGPKTGQFKQVPIPKPASGQVLVKVMASPINPSDIALYNGHYSHQKKFPTVMGFEGAGVVMQNGGGFMGWTLVGKRVAFSCGDKQGLGAYAQYVVVKQQQCLQLADNISFEQGSMSFVNPLTVLGMLDVLKSRKEKCVVLTAAASALARMMNRIYPKEGVQVINIVRRAQQVEILKKEGARHIINSSAENWEKQFSDLAKKLDARSCFEAIGGDFTGVVMKNMPKNSTITVYGCLSGKNLDGIDVMDLLVNNKVINAFLLPEWIKSKNTLTLIPTILKVKSAIGDGLKSVVAKKFKVSETTEAIKFYLEHMSEGKVIIEPWSE